MQLDLKLECNVLDNRLIIQNIATAVEPLLSGLRLTVPLTSMQFLSIFSAWAELWVDSHSYIDTQKENGKWASE
jgi:hypothetical protein